MTEEIQREREVRGAGTASPPPGAAQWLIGLLLVAAALVVVVWNWDSTHYNALEAFNGLGDDSGLGLFTRGERSPRQMTTDQRFLLEGDTTRATRHEQQRAIWEAHPDNKVYLGNYLTMLAATGAETLSLDYLRQELAAARKIDPENARMDYLEAGRLLELAAEIRSEKPGEQEDGKSKTEYALEVRDRAQLDEAMNLLREGLGKPYWRRYSGDMLEAQLAILGPPQRLIDLVQRTAIAASTLLPDLAQVKTLARASRLYAELLISEGKTTEAIPFLDAWETIARHITEDSFTLIDLLVANATLKDAEQTIPPLYRAMGREAEAARVATRAALLAKPVSDWREQRDRARKQGSQTDEQQRGEVIMQERAGVLVSMLLPALGKWPDAEAYKPGRMLEYTVFMEFMMGVVLLALLAALFVSFLLALRWRIFRPAHEPPPRVLMPDVGKIIWILLLGVILPLALFFLVTRYLPSSGHAYSARVGMHKLAAEFGLLAAALATIPILMIVNDVRRRCRVLGIPTTRWHARYLSWALGGTGVLMLVVAWFLPISSIARTLAMVGLGFTAGALAVGILLGIAQGLAGQRQHGMFYGSVFATLIPMLALTIIVLGVVTRPLLLRAEGRYIVRDTLMQDRDRVGFTRIENDLVEELRTAMLENFRSSNQGSRP